MFNLIRKKKAAVTFKMIQCHVLGCDQMFRTAKDRDQHVKDAYHCHECGFGLPPTKSKAMSAAFCPPCSVIDSPGFPTEKAMIV